MAVAWPLVRAALYRRLPPLLPGVKSYNGPVPSGQQPTKYLTVGNAPSVDDDSSGSFTQANGDDGYSVTETGFVMCELGGTSGSAEMPSVFAQFDVIASSLQADMTLGGVLARGSVVTANASVVEAQTKAGAVQRLVVSIQYQTRI